MYKLVLPIFLICGIAGIVVGITGLIDKELLEAAFSKPVPDDYVMNMLKMGIVCIGVYFIGKFIVYLGRRLAS